MNKLYAVLSIAIISGCSESKVKSYKLTTESGEVISFVCPVVYKGESGADRDWETNANYKKNESTS